MNTNGHEAEGYQLQTDVSTARTKWCELIYHGVTPQFPAPISVDSCLFVVQQQPRINTNTHGWNESGGGTIARTKRFPPTTVNGHLLFPKKPCLPVHPWLLLSVWPETHVFWSSSSFVPRRGIPKQPSTRTRDEDDLDRVVSGQALLNRWLRLMPP